MEIKWYEIRRVDNQSNKTVNVFRTNVEKMAHKCYQQWTNGNINLNYTIEFWTTIRGELRKTSSINGLTGKSFHDIIES